MGSYNYYKMFGCFNRKFKMNDIGPPPDVIEAFNVYSGNGTQLSADQLLRFLIEFQGEVGCTLSDAEQIMQQVLNQRHHLVKYSRHFLSIGDFFYLLFHDQINPPIKSQVHHDMTAPLQHYFIYTGHNSYLTGNQLSSDCSDIPIIHALERGVRGIELDLWPNSAKDEIHVLHGRTLTTPVRLDKCFKSIRQHAFIASPYPVIVTLEDHLTPSLRAKVAEMAIRIFGELLYYPEPGCFDEFPSPEELKHHIILSTKPPKEYLESKNYREKENASPKDKYASAEDLWDKDTPNVIAEPEVTQERLQTNSNPDEDIDADDSCKLEESETKHMDAIHTTGDRKSTSDLNDKDDQDLGPDSQKNSQQGTPGYKRSFAIQAADRRGPPDEYAEDCSLDDDTSSQLGAPDEREGRISDYNKSSHLETADPDEGESRISKYNQSSNLETADPDELEGRISDCNKSTLLEIPDEHNGDCGVDNPKPNQLAETDEHSTDCSTDNQQAGKVGAPDQNSEESTIENHQPTISETPEIEAAGTNKDDEDADVYTVNTRPSYQLPATECKPLASLLEVAEWSDEDQVSIDDNVEKFQLTASAYKHLIAIHADKPKDGLRRTLLVGVDKVRRLSLSEQELERAAECYGTDIVRFTQKNLVRVYPKGTRVTSSNFKPLTGWMVGAQMVAFNMQGYGRSLWLMHGMFRANGGCGYVKKPELLMKRGPHEVFDPKVKLPVKKTLKVKVYLGDGWRMDFSHTHFDAYSPPDFYTKVRIVGVTADIANSRTRIIEDDWTPTWDEEFEFPLTVPELALLQIVVQEYDMSEKDDFGGQTCFPVAELRPGIRAVPLYNKKGTQYRSVKLLMRFQFV